MTPVNILLNSFIFSGANILLIRSRVSDENMINLRARAKKLNKKKLHTPKTTLLCVCVRLSNIYLLYNLLTFIICFSISGINKTLITNIYIYIPIS